MITDRVRAASLYLLLRGRLDDLPENTVKFIRSNLSVDDRLHLWAFMLGKTGVRV